MVGALPTERLAQAMRAEAEQFAQDSSKFEKVGYLLNSDIYALLRDDDAAKKAAAQAEAAKAAGADTAAGKTLGLFVSSVVCVCGGGGGRGGG